MQEKVLDRDAFIDRLNQDLATEYRSIVQYVQYIHSIKGAKYLRVGADLRTHVSQEIEHAMTLASQDDCLAGTPNCRAPDIETQESAGAALPPLLAQTQGHVQDLRSALGQQSHSPPIQGSQ